MAEFLKDIHIIDLTRSVVDEEKSDKTKGRLVFKSKVYITNADYRDAQSRPHHKLEWANNHPDGYGVQTYELMGYDFVTKDDPYYPDGAKLNAEGHYVFKDVVLMKCDFTAWLKRRARDIEKSERASQRMQKAFVDATVEDGTGKKLGFSTDQIKDML